MFLKVGILILSASFSAFAADPACECKLDGPLDRAIKVLLKSNYELSEKLAPLEGNAFHRSSEEIEALKLLWRSEELLKRSGCEDLYNKVNRRFKVFVRLVAGPGASSAALPLQNRQRSFLMLSKNLTYQKYRDQIDREALSTLSGDCLQFVDEKNADFLPASTFRAFSSDHRYWACNEAFLGEVDKKTEVLKKNAFLPLLKRKSVEELLRDFGRTSDRDDFINFTILKGLSTGNYEGYKAYLGSVKHKLSTEEKVRLIASLGEAGDMLYDDKMLDRSAQLRFDEVTNSEIFRDISNAAFNDPSLRGYICRHNSAFQAATGDALGLEGLLVSSTASRGLHTNLLLREKNGGSEAYLLNYNQTQKTSGLEGGMLLHQEIFGQIDGSTSYLIGKADSKGGKEASIAQVTAESAKIYAEAMGNDIRVVEPLARTTTSLAGAEVVIHGRPVALFAGNDGNGQSYVGAAARLDWGSPSLPGKIGVAGGLRRQASAASGNLVEAYIDLQQGAKLKLFDAQVGKGRLSAEADALALVIGDVQHYFGEGATSAPLNVGIPIVGANVGAEVKVEVPRSGYTAKVRAETHGRVGVSDTSAMSLGVFHNLSTVSSEMAFRRNDHQAMARALVLFDVFGPKALGQLGYGYRQFAVQAEAGGRLRKDDSTIREGSIRRLGVKVRQGVEVNDSVDLVLNFAVSMPMEGGSALEATRFMGGVGGEF